MRCPACGKTGIKNLKLHQKYCSGKPKEVLMETIAAAQPENQGNGNREMKIARILYEEIVRPVCNEHAIKLGEWAEIDQSDYFKIAGRIMKEVA